MMAECTADPTKGGLARTALRSAILFFSFLTIQGRGSIVKPCPTHRIGAGKGLYIEMTVKAKIELPGWLFVSARDLLSGRDMVLFDLALASWLVQLLHS